MKYLVFNLVVAAALIYLFNGSEGGLDGFKDRALESVEAVKAQAQIYETQKQETLKQSPVPGPIVQTKVDPFQQVSVAPALPEPIDVPKLVIPEMAPLSLDPAPAMPIDQVVEPTILSFPSEENSDFMSMKDRHKSLLRLAEDMEYFSAESMSQ